MVKNTVDRKHLIDLRKNKTRVSQKQFAEMTGFSVDSIRSWERGRRLLTTNTFREIKRALGYLDDSSGSLRAMIDYLRITFKNVTDLDYFCRRYLYRPLSEFTSEETRLMMYTHLWRRGDIWIFDYADKTQTDNYQITLQLSGQGCRQFELIMEDEGLTWMEVLQKMYSERSDMKVTRLDIALDEMYKGYDCEDEHVSLLDIVSKVECKKVRFDRLKTWNFVGGGIIVKDDDDERQVEKRKGLSIYFGSHQSNFYMNFYEKRFELASKEQISVYESLEIFGIWNRYELRFSQSKAQGAIEEFIAGVDIGEIAKGIVNKEIEVYDKANDYGAYLPDEKWQKLFGGVEPLKLSVSPEPYSIERTIKWLLYQVSDSLALVDEADKIMDTEYLNMIISAGEVNERMQKTLDFLRHSRKDISI